MKGQGFSTVLFIAIRYVKGSKKTPAIGIIMSIIAVTISISMLIIVTSVMNGFRQELLDKILGFNAHITIFPIESEYLNSNQVKEIEKIENIKNASAIINGQGMLFRNGETAPVAVKGISFEDLLKRSEIISSIEGNIGLFNNHDFCAIIGKDIANKLNVKNGDYIELITPNILPTIFTIIPRYKRMKVVGIINSGSQIYDSITLLMPFGGASKIYNKQGADVIEVMLKNINKLHETQKKIIDTKKAARNWENDNSSLISALKIEANVMALILSLFVIISLFTIFATINMMVGQKEKDIAILKSLGFTQSEINKIFFTSAFSISILAIILGNLIGITVAKNIDDVRVLIEFFTGSKLIDGSVYLLSYLPSKIIISDVIKINALSFTVAIIASILPSRKASIKNPVEILRNF
jgi:lipoprotein-releasing system permease protein